MHRTTQPYLICLSIVSVMVAALCLTSCKTTEANYRSAYEKAIAARDDDDSAELDETIYGTQRRPLGHSTVETAAGRSVDIAVHLVRPAEGGGGVNENLHRYNVVAAQFKQRFNAISYRDRLAENYPSAFVVETAEPYYYIIVGSFDTLDQALQALDNYAKKPPIAPKEPCPFILDASARRRPRK